VRQTIIPQLGEADFLSWEAKQDAKFELHRGFVMAFAGGTLDHDTLAFNVRTFLARSYPPPCRTFGSDVKVKVASDTLYYPDAGVVCEPVTGSATTIAVPRIVVEVLSPGTATYDLVEKRAAYRTIASLAAFVVVHTEIRRIEVDVRGHDGSWKTETYDDPEALLDGKVLPLDDVYAQSSLSSR
jgi:Uma2 family endonuclease